MKVFLTKKQYNTILKCIAVWDWVYWIMWDMVDEKYKKDSDEIDELQNYLLWFYKDFWVDKKFIEVFEKKNYFSDEYMEKIIEDMDNYWEMEFWDKLSKRLAILELEKEYWEENLEELDRDEFLEKMFEKRDELDREFQENWLKNFKLIKNSLCK